MDVVGLASGVTAITAGNEFTCALTTSGGVKCWGQGNVGQMGDGTDLERTIPVDVVGLTSGVIAITAGQEHACALLLDGGVKCWGDNDSGQLGDGTNGDVYNDHHCRRTPVDVVGLGSEMMALTAGGAHTCALTVGGGVEVLGRDWLGQLGDGTTTQSFIPVDVDGLTSGVMAIDAKHVHTCVLMEGGGMKCWGYNELWAVGRRHDHGSLHTGGCRWSRERCGGVLYWLPAHLCAVFEGLDPVLGE